MKINKHRSTNQILLGLLTLAVIGFSGCSDQPTEVEDYNPEPILTAFLYGGEDIEPVTLEWAGGIYAYYQPGNNAISGADVKIWEIGPDPVQDTLYFEFNDNLKKYLPTNEAEWGVPQYLKSYRIEAHKASENIHMWAETVIPDTFTTIITPEPVGFDSVAILDTLNRNMAPIELHWSQSALAAGYVQTIVCLDTTYQPLDPDWDPIEDEIPEDSSRYSFDLAMAGQDFTTLAWINFWYEGWHEIQNQAVDPYYWEYFFSVFRLWMGQVNDLEYHMNGGLGVFAGITRDRYMVYIEKVE
ncbi:DUF4249 family protein [bacterium]|nr:DUF4249 family protein [bacterium]